MRMNLLTYFPFLILVSVSRSFFIFFFYVAIFSSVRVSITLLNVERFAFWATLGTSAYTNKCLVCIIFLLIKPLIYWPVQYSFFSRQIPTF